MSEQEQTKNITINMHELSNEKEFQRFKFLDHFLPVIQKQKIQISPLASKRKNRQKVHSKAKFCRIIVSKKSKKYACNIKVFLTKKRFFENGFQNASILFLIAGKKPFKIINKPLC